MAGGMRGQGGAWAGKARDGCVVAGVAGAARAGAVARHERGWRTAGCGDPDLERGGAWALRPDHGGLARGVCVAASGGELRSSLIIGGLG